ncbi:MAG: hypothetical protein GAK28_02095 [Luteibacter sp.]|uniref:nuclear transport factor 2 family protein n=1 Tax=Luteibacter sp. TaxID=1886636 RepID=UPI0013812327|nr:nuclear transport factor 2 family protein [Luteibacter sp.]KAF1007124.1 MAG: hypothetical protein GAK28_02095 [Luteibacter sp.]
MNLRRYLLAVALLLPLPILADEAAEADIRKVVETFQTSLKAHDAKTLGSLFVADSTAWYTTLGQASLDKVRKEHPDKPVPRYKQGTWQQFADYVGKPGGAIEERFHDVRIHTDGSVATVYFDFEFVSDGKVNNHGAETWQMLRTDDGWKIVAMLYSSNF